MIITKTRLSRRTLLRGAGASLALPLLDSMIPALTPLAKTAARPVLRLGAVYVPNGIMMRNWTPAEEGAGFAFTPILEPLSRWRDRVLVVSGLSNHEADAKPGEGAGDHSRGPGAFLTGVHIKKTQGADIQAGISMDQIAAQEFGRHTQLASLELGLESPDMIGSCDDGYSCAYTGTISWRTATTPLPTENDPRAVFERLFGDAGTSDPAARRLRMTTERSLLDSVTQDIASLNGHLGGRDRHKLSEYLEAVRDIERRIQNAEQQGARQLPLVDRPAGIPASFDEHARIMFDLLAVAYQCDLTRVSTFMIAREVSGRTYPEIGVPEPHHPTSHHQNNPEKVAKKTKIDAYHMSFFARFIERLQATEDGDGSLLDHAATIYGGGISDGDLHNHEDLPVVVVGGAAGQLKGDRHLRYPKNTPMANLHVALLAKLGVPVERLGDSTGGVEHLSDI